MAFDAFTRGAGLCAAAFLVATAAVAAEPVYSGRQSQLDVAIPRLEATVKIDGVLDEPVWAQAARLTEFSQYAPIDGRPAENDTEVLVWYSPAAILFGIKAHAKPGTIRATLADRDRIDADDHVQLYLGTFHDGRQALMFAVNPLGVQADGTLVEGLRQGGHGFGGLSTGREGADLSADFVFESKGRLTDEGYAIEVRIPFKTLRYQSAATQDWGLHVIRRVQSTGHEESWVPARRAAASFLGQAGTLRGLTDLRRGLVLDLNPVVTAKIDGAELTPGGSWRYDAGTPEVGGNIRWGLTPNLTLNGTINPDFSQVEADAGQFVFDPRQALFFAEKRPFFLDGIEMYATPNNLIYTRRIVAPLGAAKLTGKIAGTSVAYLAAVDDTVASTTGEDHPLFNILRVQRDIGGGSRAGFVYTDRFDGDHSNRVVGADARLTFHTIYTLQMQGALSRTHHFGVTTTAPLWDTSFTRSGRRYGFRYWLRGVADDFRAGAGFISRAGIAIAGGQNQITLYGSQGSIAERWTGDVRLDATWQYDDFVNGRASQDRRLHFNSNFTLRGGWRVGQSVLIESFGYDEDLYRDYALLDEAPDGRAVLRPFVGAPRFPNLDYQVTIDTPRLKGFSGNFFALWGKDENFYEWSSADILFLNAGGAWRPTERLRVDGNWQVQSYSRRTDGSTVGIHKLPRLKIEYQMTRAIFLRLVSQYDSAMQDDLRDDSRTELPIVYVDRATGDYELALGYERSSLRTDFLFSYQPTPGTVIFAGYGSTLADPDARDTFRRRRSSDGFFFKVSYLFRMK